MNILILTTIYRDLHDTPSAATTPIVHNFAKEWVKQGHKVLLIHNFNVFPVIAYAIPKKIWSYYSSRRGFNIELQWKQRLDESYIKDGVKVYRSTLLKYIPQGAYSELVLRKSIRKINSILKKESFIPDLIVGHLENPQIYQLSKLKQFYPGAKTCFVFHNVSCLGKKGFKGWEGKYLSMIDRIGFRCQYAEREAETKFGFKRDFFLCPSGIEDRYLESVPEINGRFTSETLRIMYAGQMIPRKHVDKIILAVNELMKKGLSVSLQIIGDGVESDNLNKLVRGLSIESAVSFRGRLPHDKVLEIMKESDVFVMISSREVFGLVYLEAMSQGCITVASEIGGMEGIIINGKNGYLCPDGDYKSLSTVLTSIYKLNAETKKEIAIEGYLTAKEYSESTVAERYLEQATEKEKIKQ